MLTPALFTYTQLELGKLAKVVRLPILGCQRPTVNVGLSEITILLEHDHLSSKESFKCRVESSNSWELVGVSRR